MPEEFDPYYEWLGIPPKDQPPNHYRLLGIELFEENLNVIDRAADRQMGHVRSFQTGKNGKISQRLLNELSAAKVCLLNAQKKADYDEQLRTRLASQSHPDLSLTVDAPIPELPPGMPDDATTAGEVPSPVVATEPTIEIRPAIRKEPLHKPVHKSVQSGENLVQRGKQSISGKTLAIAGGIIGVLAIAAVGFYVMFAGGDGKIPPVLPVNPNVAQDGGTKNDGDTSTDKTTKDDKTGKGETGKGETGKGEIGKGKVVKPSPPANTVVESPPDNSRFIAINESITGITDPDTISETPDIPPSTRDAITNATGMIDDRFAFCQTLQWGPFDEINRTMRAQGYRLSRCRPYLVQGDWRVAAVWLRDGMPFRVVGLTDSATLMQADQRLRVLGFMPVDVVGAADLSQELFSAVWVKPKSPVGLSALKIAVASEAYEASKEQMLQQGYRTAVHGAYFDTAKKRKFCDLWIKPPGEQRQSVWVGNDSIAKTELAKEVIHTDVSATANLASGRVIYAGVEWLDVKDVAKIFLGEKPDALLASAAEQVSAGNLPSSLSITAAPNGDLVGVAIWRPAEQLQTPLDLASLEPQPKVKPVQASPAPAKPELALQFAGKGSIELGDTTGKANISRDFTLEMWLRFDEPAFGAINVLCGTAAYRGLHPEVTTMVMKGWLAGIKPVRAGATTKSQFIFQWAEANGQTQNHTADVPAFDDKWHHLALCNRGSGGGWEFVLYIDGQEVARKSHADSSDAASPVGVYFGRPQWVPASRRALHGLLRGFRLSSVIRYGGNFQPETKWTADGETVALLDFSSSSVENPAAIGNLAGSRQSSPIVGANWADSDGKPINSGASATAGLQKPPAKYDAEVAKVREVFKTEIAAAKDSLALTALAEKILTQAADEQDSALQFALYSEARRFAVEAIDWNTAARTIEELTGRFEVDAWSLRAEVFGGLAKKARLPADKKMLATKAIAQAEAAFAEGSIEVIDSLLNSATSLAPRGERDLTREITDLRKRLTEERKVLQTVRDARTKLAESPNDPLANETLGKHLCFGKDDWETGVAHLAKGSDGKLTAVARNDLTQPTAAAERAALAEAWYDVSKSAADTAVKAGAAIRALHWYQLAMPELTGVKKTQAEKQVEELSKVATTPRGKAKYPWLEGDPGVALEFRGHTGDITCLAASRFGRFLVTGSLDDTIRVWDLATGKPGQILSGSGDVISLLLSADDRSVAIPLVGSGEYSIGILNLQTRQPVGSVKADNSARQLAGSPDWKRVVYSKNQAGQGNLLVYNLSGLQPVAPLSCPGTPVQVAVSRSGRFLAAADDNNVVYVWDMQTGKPVSPLTGHNEQVTGLAFSPNERQLVSCSYRTLIIWDLVKGLEEQRIRAQDTGATALTYTTDGGRLLVSGQTMEVSVYNIQNGALIAQLRAPEGSGTPAGTRAIVSFADGRAAATVGSDSIVRVWRLPQ